MSSMATRISRYFELDRYGTTIRTEIIAGVATYLSLAYIFIVSPAILSQAGIDPVAVLFATAMVSAIATLVMGLWANLPFAVAPGLTMSSYFAFVVCAKMGFTWQQALAAVFVSGVLCCLLTALPLRQKIIDSIPAGLKQAITVMIGIFIAAIGLFIAKVISFTPDGWIDLAKLNPINPFVLVLLAGLTISAVLGMKRFRFSAGMIMAIIVASLIHHGIMPENPAPNAAGGDALSATGALDFSILFESHFWLPVIVFFVLDFFEGIGQFIGLTSNTSIQDKDGNVPHVKQALWVDSAGTVAGSLLGTSSLIVFVESAVGIRAGGRTGLTAVVVALLMLLIAGLGFYFAPLLALVPAEAASGVLIYVGYLILSGAFASHVSRGLTRFDAVIATIMAMIALLTFSLDKSLAFGMWAYFGHSVSKGKPAWWLAIIAFALSVAIIYGS